MKRVMRVILICGSVVSSVWAMSGARAEEAALAAIPIEALLDLESVGPPWLGPAVQISADGRWVALLISRTNPTFETSRFGFTRDQFRSKIQVVNVATGEAVDIRPEGQETTFPAWSPDSGRLLFQSGIFDDARLWVWSVADQKAKKLSDVTPTASNSGPLWTPDSRSVVVAAPPDGHTIATISDVAGTAKENHQVRARLDPLAAGAQVAVYRSSVQEPSHERLVREEFSVDLSPDDNIYLGDLVAIDVATGGSRRLTTGYRPTRYRISPDGRMVAFTHKAGRVRGRSHLNVYDVMTVGFDGRPPQVVAESVVKFSFVMDLSWSPNSKQLAFCGSRVRESATEDLALATDSSMLPQQDCFVAEVAGGTLRSLDALKGKTNRLSSSAPLWSGTGYYVYGIAKDRGSIYKIRVADLNTRRILIPEGKELIQVVADRMGVVTQKGEKGIFLQMRDLDTGDQGFYVADTETARLRALHEEAVSISHDLDINSKAQLVAYICEGAGTAPQAWISDLSFKDPRPISNLNAHLQHYQMGRSRLIMWRGPQGEQLRGALLLPPDYREGRRYPLVLDIYGGSPLSTTLNRFGVNQLGAAVFNRQLLATRGYAVLKADTVARVGSPMADIAESALLGVDKVIRDGVADPERLAVTGQSYGGYSTFAIVVQDQRFKAAIPTAGFTSLLEVFSSELESGAPDGKWIGWAENTRGNMRASLWEDRDRWIENSPLFYLDQVATPVLILHGAEDNIGHKGIPAFLALKRLGKEVELAQYLNEGHVISGRANSIDYSRRMIMFLDRYLDISRDQNGKPKWNGTHIASRNGDPVRMPYHFGSDAVRADSLTDDTDLGELQNEQRNTN